MFMAKKMALNTGGIDGAPAAIACSKIPEAATRTRKTTSHPCHPREPPVSRVQRSPKRPHHHGSRSGDPAELPLEQEWQDRQHAQLARSEQIEPVAGNCERQGDGGENRVC